MIESLTALESVEQKRSGTDSAQQDRQHAPARPLLFSTIHSALSSCSLPA